MGSNPTERTILKTGLLMIWKPKHRETANLWFPVPNGEVPENALSKFLRYHLRGLICENCGKIGRTVETENGPSYASELPWQHRDNPNRTRCFCPECKEGWEEYWGEMWAMARGSYG